MTGFSNPWHADMIERFTVDADKKDSPEVKAACILSRSLLASVCILSESIDGLAGKIGGGEFYGGSNLADEVRGGLGEIAEAISQCVEAIKEGRDT